MSEEADILEEARLRFASAMDAEDQNRKDALDDVRFITGAQWMEADRKDRALDGRPMLTINKLPQFVKQIVNEQRRNRPGIVVRPVDDQSDIETARIYEGLIRNIETTSTAETIYDCAHEWAVSMGWGYWRIVTEYEDDNSFDLCIKLKRVRNPFTVAIDPLAQEWTKEDARFGFVFDVMGRKEFLRRWPKASPYDANQIPRGASYEGWFEKESVRVAEYFSKEPAKRHIALLSDGQVIELPDRGADGKFSSRVDYLKAYLEARSAQGNPVTVLRERDVDGHKIVWRKMIGNAVLQTQDFPSRYIPIIECKGDEYVVDGKDVKCGIIRYAKDPQRLYNYWQTSAAEMLAQAPKAPYIAAAKQIENYRSEWLIANKKNVPVLRYDPVPGEPRPGREPFPTTPTGHINQMLIAADDLKAVTGIYDPSLGQRSNETSGIAIAERQEQTTNANFNFTDNLNRAIAYTGKILVDMIPRVYDTAKVVRILSPSGESEMVQINREFQDHATGEPRLYDVTKGRYDVVVDAGPGYATKREQAAQFLLQLVQAMPHAAPVLAPILVRNIDMEGADEAEEALRSLIAPPVSPQQTLPGQMAPQIAGMTGPTNGGLQ